MEPALTPDTESRKFAPDVIVPELSSTPNDAINQDEQNKSDGLLLEGEQEPPKSQLTDQTSFLPPKTVITCALFTET